MSRRQWLVWPGLVGTLCLSTFALLPSGPGITKANFDHVEKGMDRAEVEKLFKGTGTQACAPACGNSCTSFQWTADDRACASISFVDSKVHEKRWTPSTETYPEKVCRWFATMFGRRPGELEPGVV